jgi:hypothetical protein
MMTVKVGFALRSNLHVGASWFGVASLSTGRMIVPTICGGLAEGEKYGGYMTSLNFQPKQMARNTALSIFKFGKKTPRNATQF